MFPDRHPKHLSADACAPRMDTADCRRGMWRDIYGWLCGVITETVQLHMVYVKEILGRGSHCGAPRYREWAEINPGSIKEEWTGSRQLKITVKGRLFISVSVQWELSELALSLSIRWDLFQRLLIQKKH